MTTLVTGATGLVGNNVVRLLLDRGQQVRVLVRSSSSLKALDGLNVKTVSGDVTNLADVERAFDGVSRAIHCAAEVYIGWQRGPQQQAINVEGTRHVADTALAHGARLVHVSSIDALGVGSLDQPADENSPFDGTVLCPYVATKREAERVVLDRVAQGLDAVIVNPGFMLGPSGLEAVVGSCALEDRHRLGAARTARSEFLLRCPRCRHGYSVRAGKRSLGPALDVLAGQTLSYREAIKLFARIIGTRPPIRTARNVTVNLVGRVGDLLTKITGRKSDVNSASTAMSLLPKNFSSPRAKAELGYQSRDVEQSATDAWAWLQKYGYVKA